MLAGLIFAIEEAEDRPGTLAATLPFGGMTLLEYQVRLLGGAGAERVMVAVGRMTPALLNAVQRASRKGLEVEVVRSAEEASEKIPGDARVLVFADGLVTTDPVIERMSADGAEALLVTDDPNSPAAIERLDMRDSWAGIARVTGAQLGEIAQMPADYDFQSALLRVAVQAKAEHIPLTAGWLKSGHSVERSAAALTSRGNIVLAALTDRRASWAERWVFTRFARVALPELTGRNVPSGAVLLLGSLFGIAGLGAIAGGLDGVGLVAAVVALALLTAAAAMSALGADERSAARTELGMSIFSGLALLSAGGSARIVTGSWTPLVLALVAVGCQALVERAPSKPKRWWSSPAGLVLILTPFALLGWTGWGLAVPAIYAFATLAAAVEATREKS